MPAPKAFTKAYAANDIDKLDTLELSCETDEANLTAKIVKLELARTEDGTDATAVTYEEADLNANLGNLTIIDYQTDVDATSLTAIHKTQGEDLLLKGQAYVKDKTVKVLVF